MNRLRIPFDVVAPHVDETPSSGESPHHLALRLALTKAKAVAALHPEAVVIGSDQVADLDGEPLGKPGTHERATRQLQRMRGKSVIFQTAVETSTQDVFLESAFFHPDAIAGRARRSGWRWTLRSASSAAWILPLPCQALERVIESLVEICGGSVGEISEVRGKMPAREAIMLRCSRIYRALGITIPQAQVEALLNRLQLILW